MERRVTASGTHKKRLSINAHLSKGEGKGSRWALCFLVTLLVTLLILLNILAINRLFSPTSVLNHA